MFQGAIMSNSTLNLSDETNNNNNINNNNITSFNPLLLQNTSNIISSSTQQQQQQQETIAPKKVKKKRNLPGNPDPEAEVIALSPKSLLATNRFICEICNKGFQRDQNLQLHRRGHNLPWKLKQRNKHEIVRKKAYVCPEPSCVHHHPSRALGDLTGIKKHFCRKHGEKKFKCDKCSKIYAVHSDWKAHSKTCGTREYRCDCGTLFSRKDSFITHRAFCDALAEESARLSTNPFSNPMFPPPQSMPPPPPPPFPTVSTTQNPSHLFPFPSSSSPSPWDPSPQNPNNNNNNPHHHLLHHIKTEINHHFSPPPQPPPPQQPPPPSFFQPPPLFSSSKGMMSSPFTSDTNTITAHFLSATALLQKATAVGATLQQSQHSQHAQVSLLNGFDELGATFCHVGQPPPQQQPQQQSPSSTTTTTTATATATANTNYNPYNAMGMNLGNFATWRKNNNNEDTTRDFLGLTAGDHHHHDDDDDDDGDDMEKNMLKFTSGLQYNMTTPYDHHHHHDNSSSPSSSSSTMLFKPHHQTFVNHHHHQNHQQHHEEGNLGNFVTTELPSTTSDSRWG
ncbi:hypothetical protein RND81_10G236500 [Saponaria officinalis]|uniref:C2H2-type domain-containing protein n=1 Tax=Saponaria officinalis TaxID=3572 RepID=A0AAW1I7P8_SAPOF